MGMSDSEAPPDDDSIGPIIFHLGQNGTVSVPKEFREKMESRKLLIRQTEDDTLEYKALDYGADK